MSVKDCIQRALDAANELESKLLKKRSRRASKKSCLEDVSDAVLKRYNQYLNDCLFNGEIPITLEEFLS